MTGAVGAEVRGRVDVALAWLRCVAFPAISVNELNRTVSRGRFPPGGVRPSAKGGFGRGWCDATGHLPGVERLGREHSGRRGGVAWHRWNGVGTGYVVSSCSRSCVPCCVVAVACRVVSVMCHICVHVCVRGSVCCDRERGPGVSGLVLSNVAWKLCQCGRCSCWRAVCGEQARGFSGDCMVRPLTRV